MGYLSNQLKEFLNSPKGKEEIKNMLAHEQHVREIKKKYIDKAFAWEGKR